jgi:hypothetical protein
MELIHEYWQILIAGAMIVGAWSERRATLNQHERIIGKLTTTLEALDVAVDSLNVTVARIDQRLITVESRAA